MKKKRKILCNISNMKALILFGICAVLFFFIGTYLHEQVHKQIFADYGLDSKVYYFEYFPDVATVPNGTCPNTDCLLANEMVDAIGYQTQQFYLLFLIAFLMIIGLLEKNPKNVSEGEKYEFRK